MADGTRASIDLTALGTRPGIQPCQWIHRAVAAGLVRCERPLAPGQVQPNSVDLRLGRRGHRVQCSFLPGPEGVARKLERYRWYDVELGDEGYVLERNAVYLFELQEALSLPPGLSARSNPKSSTGRLDVFTRLVTAEGTSFDEVPEGYEGKLYLEVVPRSFAIRVREGDTLAQLRFAHGTAQLGDDEVREALDTLELVTDNAGAPLSSRALRVSSGVFLSVLLDAPGAALVGYRALKNTRPIDLRALGALPVREFWEPIAPSHERPVILEPNEFYIFASRELVRLPPGVCAEMVPFDAGSGELRTHYAGFFDSGFGYARDRDAGSSAAAVVLEVRNHDVPFVLEDGHPLFRLIFFRNAEAPEVLYGQGIGSNYQAQRLKLGKQFAAP